MLRNPKNFPKQTSRQDIVKTLLLQQKLSDKDPLKTGVALMCYTKQQDWCYIRIKDINQISCKNEDNISDFILKGDNGIEVDLSYKITHVCEYDPKLWVVNK